LRRKLDAPTELIRTLRGLGYQFASVDLEAEKS
jgi:DNA-binding response OmpR family regulator